MPMMQRLLLAGSRTACRHLAATTGAAHPAQQSGSGSGARAHLRTLIAARHASTSVPSGTSRGPKVVRSDSVPQKNAASTPNVVPRELGGEPLARLPEPDADALRVFQQLMTDIGVEVTEPLHKACFRRLVKQFKPGSSYVESDIQIGAAEVRHPQRVRCSNNSSVACV